MSASEVSVDLRTRLGQHQLTSPLLTASGCAGFGHELKRLGALEPFGALITPSLCHDGHSASDVHLAEGPSSVVFGRETAGIATQGLDASSLPWEVCDPTPVIVSIWGRNSGDFADAAADVRRRSAMRGLLGVEVNLSVGNESNSDRPFARDEYSATKVIARVREHLPRNVLLVAKLILGSDVLEIARGAVKSGADVIALGYPPAALNIDPMTLAPSHSARASFAGPALLPMMLGSVYELRAHMEAGRLGVTPIIAGGGVAQTSDVVAALAAGASAVSVGSALFHDPHVGVRLHAGLTQELQRRQCGVTDLIAAAHR